MEANKENLYRHVKFLTSIYPYRNYKNLESLHQAANFIEAELKKTGLLTTRQEWEADENTYENIIASYQPEKTKRFIIGAHYDVYKEQPGADDNASSVAGLIEMARMLTENKLKLNYGIDFVSFCLEEPPFFKKKEMGSYIHAKSIYNKNKEYMGMIALEMIGYYHEKENSAENTTSNKGYLIVSGIKKYDEFNKKISHLLKANGGIDSRRLSYANNYRNNGPSDHRNYWQLNVPAAMVIGTGGHGNPNYHKVTDTIHTLNFEIMTQAVNSLAYAVFNFLK
ncbi:M28 family peptidase [Mesonia ostreae]|uniref:M28 family peptidase n=1 Tax=Mesonia ostreae TaxID=861110 RepID=A0ABU2KKZ2_9FLAO|nr:M28 family peptidase [Mesonia ostreae]MDT0295398.1 M28 family peptidase [Mesonia ostreae]